MQEHSAQKAIVRSVYERLYHQKDLAAVDELLAPDFQVFHPYAGLPCPLNRDGFRMILAGFIAGMPDMRMQIEELVEEGDLVVARVRLEGTHLGPLLGMPATGRSVSLQGMTLYQLRDGKIIRQNTADDVAGMMRQLGAGAAA